jgi:rare lipoprotein A
MRFPEAHNLPLGAALVVAVMLAAPVARADGSPNGPAADFPVTVGEPYTVGDTSYTPANTMNYDAVGYASVGEGTGVTAAHHTLPLPAYVEVTALDSGKTVLVRVERRGPMRGTNLIELSPAAAAQLGLGEGASRAGVRVRRVNPPEGERAILRAGANAPDRMPTPKPLLAVLARKLPAEGTVQLSSGAPLEKRLLAAATPQSVATPVPVGKPMAKPVAKPHPARLAQASPADAGAPFVAAEPGPIKNAPKPRPAPRGKPAPKLAMADSAAAQPAAQPSAGAVVVQAGAYSVKANAQSVARKLGAKLDPAGSLWRVRMGPFVNTADAEATLAKARAAGYTARIQRAE